MPMLWRGRMRPCGALASLLFLLASKTDPATSAIPLSVSGEALHSHLPSHPLYNPSEGSLNPPSSWDGDDEQVLLDLHSHKPPPSRPRGRVATRMEDPWAERRGSSSVWFYRSESVEKKRALLHFQRQAFAREWEGGELNRSALPIQPFRGYPRRGNAFFMHHTPSSLDDGDRALIMKLRGQDECEEDLDWVMKDVNEGLLVGERITRMADSAGGAYVMRNAQGEPHSIFKPLDEEPGAKHHIKESRAEKTRRLARKGFVKGSRKGIQNGEAGYRERAVYLLDRGGPGKNLSSSAGVPPVALVTCSGDFRCELFRPDSNVCMDFIEESTSLMWENNPEAVLHALPSNFSCGWSFVNDTWVWKSVGSGQKVGAMIKFVPHLYTIREWSPDSIPKDQVHRMALLDIRTMNLDRHAGNILVQFVQHDAPKESKSDWQHSDSMGKKVTLSRPGANATVRIVPVNNGYCLPESISIRVQEIPNDVRYAWEDWPQAKEKISEETLNYIRSLDSEKDAEMLAAEKGLKLKPAAMTVLKVGTVLLKQCTEAGMTFHDIASLMRTVGDQNETVFRGGNRSQDVEGRGPGESTLNALLSRARTLSSIEVKCRLKHTGLCNEKEWYRDWERFLLQHFTHVLKQMLVKWRREQEEEKGRPMSAGSTPCLRSPSSHLYEMVSTFLQDLEGFQLDDDDGDAADPQHDFSCGSSGDDEGDGGAYGFEDPPRREDYSDVNFFI